MPSPSPRRRVSRVMVLSTIAGADSYDLVCRGVRQGTENRRTVQHCTCTRSQMWPRMAVDMMWRHRSRALSACVVHASAGGRARPSIDASMLGGRIPRAGRRLAHQFYSSADPALPQRNALDSNGRGSLGALGRDSAATPRSSSRSTSPRNAPLHPARLISLLIMWPHALSSFTHRSLLSAHAGGERSADELQVSMRPR